MKPVLHKTTFITYRVQAADLDEFVKDCVWHDFKYDDAIKKLNCGCYDQFLHGSCGCFDFANYGVDGKLSDRELMMWEDFKKVGSLVPIEINVLLNGLCKDGWLEAGCYEIRRY